MAYTGSITAGGEETPDNLSTGTGLGKPKLMGGRRLFERKNPGSPGKLGKTSTKAESLSKLRGKGALA